MFLSLTVVSVASLHQLLACYVRQSGTLPLREAYSTVTSVTLADMSNGPAQLHPTPAESVLGD